MKAGADAIAVGDSARPGWRAGGDAWSGLRKLNRTRCASPFVPTPPVLEGYPASADHQFLLVGGRRVREPFGSVSFSIWTVARASRHRPTTPTIPRIVVRRFRFRLPVHPWLPGPGRPARGREAGSRRAIANHRRAGRASSNCGCSRARSWQPGRRAVGFGRGVGPRCCHRSSPVRPIRGVRVSRLLPLLEQSAAGACSGHRGWFAGANRYA